jgi:thiosulfate reductase cytochrome b subunit
MADTRKMTRSSEIGGGNAGPAQLVIHSLYLRIAHWLNAVAILLMVGSGWQIYNASPLFAFVFPASVTLGGWLAAGLLWHLAAMWLLIGNGVVYVTWGLATGRFRKKLLPIRPGEVVRDVGAALSGRLSHNDLTHYNAVQKLLYAGILLAGAVIVASGFAIWKPVQLRELAALFGGYQGARLVHFFAMTIIVVFLVVHVVMALLVPKSLRAIIRGR